MPDVGTADTRLLGGPFGNSLRDMVGTVRDGLALRGDIAAGQAAREAIDPDQPSGINANKFNSIMKAQPGLPGSSVIPAITGAAEASRAGTGASGAIFGQNKDALAYAANGLGILASKPDLTHMDFNAQMARLSAVYGDNPAMRKIITSWVLDAPRDPKALKGYISNVLDTVQRFSIGTPALSEPREIPVDATGGRAYGTAGEALTQAKRNFPTSGAPQPAGAPRAPAAPANGQPTQIGQSEQPRMVLPPVEGASGPLKSSLGPGEQARITQNVAAATRLQEKAAGIAETQTLLSIMSADLARSGGRFGAFAPQEKEWLSGLARIGLLGPKTLEELAGMESFDKASSQMVAQMQETNSGTDAALYNSRAANPNIKLSKIGNAAIIPMLQGQLDATQLRATMMQSVPPEEYFKHNGWFNKNVDPRVFQFNRMDTAQKQNYLNELGPKEAQVLRDNYNKSIRNGWLPSPLGQPDKIQGQ